ncbi:MAG: hypothetical protein JXA90_17125 [Planctomycetes bacterium]|nr:hypothetical protein [Planctomycetota bacterium]
MGSLSSARAAGRQPGHLRFPALRWLALAVAFAAPSLAAQQGGDGELTGEGYRFLLRDVEACPGELFTMAVEGQHETSVQGFSLAARYPSDSMTILGVHARDTIVEAVGTDYIEVKISPAEGVLVVGVLVDVSPPFEGNVIPPYIHPLPFLYVEARLGPAVEDDLVVRLEDGLSMPPIYNVFVVDNTAVPVDELTEGRVRLPYAEVPAFLRGDANLDGARDISDAIAILAYQFSGGERLECRDAADANDDYFLDVSDAIYLLGFLFVGSPPPPPPGPAPGIDPTPGGLGCECPLGWIRVLR